MRIRHLARNIAVVGVVMGGLMLTGGVSQAVELPDLPLPLPTEELPLPEVPGVPDLPSLPDLPDLPLPGAPDGPDSPRPAPDSDHGDATPCAVENPIEVDQSDDDFTTLTISATCAAEKSFHKIVSAEVAGKTILQLDTSTYFGGYGEHSTTLRLPKAKICVTDIESGDAKCLPL